MTGFGAGVVLIAMALVMRRKGRTPRIVAWLCLIAGIGLANAFLGNWARTILGWVGQFIGNLTDPAFGRFFLLALAVAALYEFIHDAAWKGHTANTATAVVALLLPALWVGQGGSVGTAVNSALASLNSSAASAMASAFGG
jgi:hypothetical protein